MLYFLENRLVIIGGNGNSGYISSTEIINEGKDLKCSIPSFPYGVSTPSTTITPTGILVCGGEIRYRYSNKCYQYKKLTSKWLPFPSMTTQRSVFDMKYLNNGIWATGGTGGSGSKGSLDYFDMTLNYWTKKNMPIDSSYHCLTKISEHKLILIGGFQGYSVRKREMT